MNKVTSRDSMIKRDWTLALVITLIAFFSHLYQLGDLWPVPHFDPANNGLDALRVIRRGVMPIFFPANGGREPLFLYLQALSMWGLGVNNFALRLPGALAGALTAPALFGFAKVLLSTEDHLLRRWVPAWASLGLALSVWSVSQTRTGLRAAILPLISVGMLWLFVTGWRKANLPRLAAAGALLGLSGYTYTAARFLPFAITLVALPDLLAKPTERTIPRWQRWSGLGIMALVAITVFAPLGWYYLHHPFTFDERAASVMIWNVLPPNSGSTLAGELALSLWRTLFWFIRLPVPLLAGLAVGLGLTLTHLRRFEYRLLPIWWLTMLVPAVLTTETPNLLRSLGAILPTYLMIGLGLATIATWLIRRWPVSQSVTLVSGLLIVTLSSWPALWNYFHPTRDDPKAGAQVLADALTTEAQTGIVYLPLSAYADPSLRFLLAAKFEQRAEWSIAPSRAPAQLVQPVEGSASPTLVRLSPDGWITFLPSLSPNGQTALRELIATGQPISDSTGTVLGYEVTLPPLSDPAHYLVQADFHTDSAVVGLADLAGYRLDSPTILSPLPHLAPGGPLWITTFWQAHGKAGEDYELIIRLVDDAGRLWGRSDGPPLEGAYSTSMWQPGEKVADGRLLWVDPGAPPGRYWLDVAFYDYPTDSRLAVSGSPMSDTIRLGPLKIPLPPLTESPDGAQPQPARFGDVAQLLGYRLTTQAPGFTLTLYWKAESPDGVDYTVFVHLLDEAGQLVMGQDNQPRGGNYPTGIWEPGEVIADDYTFNTSDLPPGKYQLEIGMYVLATDERLPIYMPDGTEEPGRHLMLTRPIEVR
jgi:4-amino-4-deoxy-L-arabinose transferase-like glycosyltransferase